MTPEVAALSKQIQTVWTLVCAALVLFMQAGFTCLESGSVREKNSINVAVKNVLDLCVSFPAYFVIGYALMFAPTVVGVVGTPGLFLADLAPKDLNTFLYQAAFCATSATIVSGAIAERCRFLPYLIVTAAVSFFIYPLFGHWAWGGGFLAALGYHDFAGSSVVHMVGAGVGLAGVQVLGAREGRFDRDGRPRPIQASSMPMVALGTMILLFGWIGFNGGSAPLGENTPSIVVHTVLAGCFGGLAAMLIGWALRGLAQVDLVFNGLLGGLVAITACADMVSLPASAAIGVLGGIAVVVGYALLDALQLDDAVGAVPVHGFAGGVGILCTALFAQPAALEQMRLDRWEFLGVQFLGMATCAVWSYYTGFALWYWVGVFLPLRVDAAGERVGMNFSEHQVAGSARALREPELGADAPAMGELL